MNRREVLATLTIIGLSTGPRSARGLPADTEADVLWQKYLDEAFAKVDDDPHLPRVLLIGDSISIYYTAGVRKLLRGTANVHRIPVNGGNTNLGVKELDQWLGTGKWDLIHFNWGLHDLIIKEQGEHAVSLDQYQRNLRDLVLRLKATRATLVWATTTPVPERIKAPGPTRKNSDAITYNAAALAIMQENHIRVDDLYEFVLPRLKELQIPDDVHFDFAGCDALAEQVARTIKVALPR